MMAQTRFVTPSKRWLSREGFSDRDIEERCWPMGGAMWASPFPERRCIYTRKNEKRNKWVLIPVASDLAGVGAVPGKEINTL
jgi:hypothetical protein